nr:phosphatidylinositol-glycan biosynthesis class X protein-like isoform X1 [Megalopta genalis]
MILSCTKQYFMYANLIIISIFQNVVCQELSARISLTTKGEGFHRFLMYEINLDDLIDDCYIALYLRLPPALYTSIDELNDLKRSGVNTICSLGETNVELFMEKANSQSVTICSPLTSKKFIFNFPIHQRYQYASDNNKYMNITLPKPNLLLGCKKRIKEYRISTIDLCPPCVEVVNKWREIPYIMDTGNVTWTIPVGNSSILTTITYTTLISTILCSLFLMKTICKSAFIKHEKEE